MFHMAKAIHPNDGNTRCGFYDLDLLSKVILCDCKKCSL